MRRSSWINNLPVCAVRPDKEETAMTRVVLYVRYSSGNRRAASIEDQ